MKLINNSLKIIGIYMVYKTAKSLVYTLCSVITKLDCNNRQGRLCALAGGITNG